MQARKLAFDPEGNGEAQESFKQELNCSDLYFTKISLASGGMIEGYVNQCLN